MREGRALPAADDDQTGGSKRPPARVSHPWQPRRRPRPGPSSLRRATALERQHRAGRHRDEVPEDEVTEDEVSEDEVSGDEVSQAELRGAASRRDRALGAGGRLVREQDLEDLARERYARALDQWHACPERCHDRPPRSPEPGGRPTPTTPTAPTTPTNRARDGTHRHRLGPGRPQPDSAGRTPGQRPDHRDRDQPQQSADIIYQGTAGGGVWRTLDGGDTWTPIFDRQLSLGIGEPGGIAIDPNDTQHDLRRHQQPRARRRHGPGSSSRPTAARAASGSAPATRREQRQRQPVLRPVTSTSSSSTRQLRRPSTWRRRPASSARPTAGRTGRPGRASPGMPARWCSTDLAGRRPDPVRRASPAPACSGRPTAARTGPRILSAATPAVAAAVGGTAGRGRSARSSSTSPRRPSPPERGRHPGLYVALSGQGGAPDPVGLFLSTDQGATWTQRDRDRHAGQHAGRLQLPHGRRPRLARRRRERHRLRRHASARAGPPTPAATSPLSPACTPTPTPGPSSGSRRRRRRSSTAATTAACSAPTDGGDHLGGPATPAACRPRCSTTSP